MKRLTYKQLIKCIYFLSLIIFIGGFILDISVTTTIYKYNPQYFFANEANNLLTNALKDGADPIFNSIIISNFLYICPLIVSYNAYMKTQSRMRGCFLLFFLMTTICFGAFHVMGGLGWWR